MPVPEAHDAACSDCYDYSSCNNAAPRQLSKPPAFVSCHTKAEVRSAVLSITKRLYEQHSFHASKCLFRYRVNRVGFKFKGCLMITPRTGLQLQRKRRCHCFNFC